MSDKEVLAKAYAIENHQGQWYSCQIGSVHNVDLLVPLLAECIPQRQPRTLVFHSETQISRFLADPDPSLSGLQRLVRLCRTSGATTVLSVAEMYGLDENLLEPTGDGEWVEQIRQHPVLEPRRLEAANDEICLYCACTDETKMFRMIRASIRNFAVAGLLVGHPVAFEPIHATLTGGEETKISLSNGGSGVAVFDDNQFDPEQLYFWKGFVSMAPQLPVGQWDIKFYAYEHSPFHEAHGSRKKRSPRQALRIVPLDVCAAATPEHA